MDPLRHGVNLRPDLLAAGMTDRELRTLRHRGALRAVRPGAYVVGEAADPVARHRLAVHAAVAQWGRATVVSHTSAAVLHGLALWNAPLDRVHGTRDRVSGARCNPFLHLHAATLAADEVVVVDGLAVTSVARTLADLARLLPFESALVPADAALHRHATTVDGLRDAVDRAARRPGNAGARRVVAFADARAESPGETRSRVALHRAGLPPPVLQREFPVLGVRVDFSWDELGTVGEFDGRVKCGRLLQPRQDPGEVVFAEKLREDALRDLGCEVVRWTWSDLADFVPVAARLRRAFARRT